jgi:hypothetical protein
MMRWVATAGALTLSASLASAQRDTARYCVDLQRVVRLSAAADKLASITGDARGGEFSCDDACAAG